MNHITKTVLSFMIIILTVASLASAEDWLQWRGPNRDGISTETGWFGGGELKTLWQQEVGLGYSSFAVNSVHAYTIGYDIPAKEDIVYCLDVTTGEPVWTYRYPAKRWKKAHAGGTNTTPTLSDGKVYILNRDGNLYCFNAADGEVLWHHQVCEKFGAELPTWGFACSPLIMGDELIVDIGMVMAFDKNTGKKLWASAKYPVSYTTPTPFTYKNRNYLALFNAEGAVVIDRDNRREITGYTWKTSYDVNPASPIIVDDKIFISSGYNHGGALFKLTPKNLTPIWENKNLRTKVNTATYIDGYLYAIDEKAGLRCVDFNTGKLQWEQKDIGDGAMSVADGKFLILTKKGEFIIAEVSSESFKPLVRKKVLSGGKYWTVPVLANGRIYLRNSDGQMVCLSAR